MKIAVLCLVPALAACSPAAAPKPDPAKDADGEPVDGNNPYFGIWTLASAKVAPWWDQKGTPPEADKQMTQIMFGARKSSGSSLLDCDKPKYSVSITEPRDLFEGSLPDANTAARSLGFNIANDITTMNFSCAIGAKDVSLDFPMVDDNTIMLGLDNILYIFTRKTGS